MLFIVFNFLNSHKSKVKYVIYKTEITYDSADTSLC